MPSGPGVIPDARIAEVAAAAPPSVETVLLTSLRDPDAIARQHARLRTTAIQLVDRLPGGARQRLRAALPGVRLIQVVHVSGVEALDEAEEAARTSDALLLDSGNPALQVKALGGTGRRHDWALSRAIRERIETPVILAGGLNAGNVAEAIGVVRPYAVDVCTGVRAEAFALDPEHLSRFAEATGSSAV